MKEKILLLIENLKKLQILAKENNFKEFVCLYEIIEKETRQLSNKKVFNLFDIEFYPVLSSTCLLEKKGGDFATIDEEDKITQISPSALNQINWGIIAWGDLIEQLNDLKSLLELAD
mgnify:CR=1 FL=1